MATTNEEFNQDELEPPTWMNEEFFIKVLHNCEQNSEDLAIKSFKISPASLKGDHYASIMFRANVEYSVGAEIVSKSLIIKTMPELDGPKKDLLGESYIFETEIGMYTEVLPRFEQILRDIGDDTLLMAPCLYHSTSPHKLMVFEDLVPLGFKVLRDRDVNAEELECIFTKLAKWHAISYKLNLEEPEFFANYRHHFVDLPHAMEQGFISDGVKYITETCKLEPELNEFLPYFEKLQPHLLNHYKQSISEHRQNPQTDAYYVLCHGDFHMQNMMFQYDKETGKFQDVMLHDFQMSNIGPIAMDLINSIYMVLDAKARDDWPRIIFDYFTKFTETLKRIGFKGSMPKLVKLREQMMRHRHLELFVLVTFFPIWCGLRVDSVDPNDLMNSADVRSTLYKNPKFVAELKKILPRYLHLGYFEE